MRKSPELVERTKLGGICVSCQKASHCTFPRDHSRPVLQCNEFNGYPPAARKAAGRRNPSLAGSWGTRSTKKPEESKYHGLCVNCKIRETCTFPKPEGGVWRCEEYE